MFNIMSAKLHTIIIILIHERKTLVPQMHDFVQFMSVHDTAAVDMLMQRMSENRARLPVSDIRAYGLNFRMFFILTADFDNPV